MDSKKLVVSIENFDKIKTAIMSDAAIVTSENGGVVYARVSDLDDNYGAGVLIAGDTPAILYGIADIIIKVSKKSDYTIPTIIKTVINIIYEIKNEV